MADFYAGLATTATNLIRSKGQLLTFTRSVAADFDPTLGKDEYEAETTYTGYGVMLPYDVLFTAGGEGSKTKLLLEAISTVPIEGDTVVVSGDDFIVDEVTPLSPAGTTVFYNLLLKR